MKGASSPLAMPTTGDGRVAPAAARSEILYMSPPSVADAVARLGRTEDVALSPSSRRLAVAALTRNEVAVFDVDIVSRPGGAHVALTGGVLLSSPALRQPHGVDFVDDHTLIVTSRGSDVALFTLPSGDIGVPTHEVRPVARWPVGRATGVNVPGSVAVTPVDQHSCDILVCNNAGHTVTCHRLDRSAAGIPGKSRVLLRKYLDIPDGVSVSRDRRWIAVSNHNPHNVLLYEKSPALNADSNPDGILRGVSYPHGLCFSADGRYLVVADAGAPYIHIYAQDANHWRGVRHPSVSARIMSEEAFQKRRHSPAQGGPKGIDIDPGASVIVVTSEYQPLAFFSLPALLQHAASDDSVREQGGVAADYELMLMDERHRLAQRVSDARNSFENSTSWRITAPLRWVASTVRRHRVPR
jgi:DNA-binding beta-propeller fold protein YncE